MESIDKTMKLDRKIRMHIWGIASELVRLDGLQNFAFRVESSDPVDIKQTAEILAEAQLKLRKLSNSRNNDN